MEKRERIKLERRLRLAEDSLKRLDGALRDSGLKVSLEIEADVTTLKCKTPSTSPRAPTYSTDKISIF